jgi:hypothetical protein
MRTPNYKRNRKKVQMVKVSAKDLLALVSSRLKGKNLFPEKLKDAKEVAKKLR